MCLDVLVPVAVVSSVALSANEAMTCKLHGEKSWRLKDTFSGDSKCS